MPFLLNVRLRDKFLLIIISILALGFIAFSYGLLFFEHRQLITSAQSRGEILTRSISYGVVQALLSPARDQEVKKAVSLLQNDPGILNVTVTDADGNLVYYSSLPSLSTYAPSDEDTRVQQARAVVHSGAMEFSYPLYDGTSYIGTLQIDYSLESALAGLEYFRYFLVIAVFVILVIATGLAIVLSRLVTRQIDLLSEAVIRVTNNNFSHRVQVVTHDELGELAIAFNNLFLNLKDSHKEAYIKTKTLLAEKNKLQSIITNLSEGVIVTDQGLRIIEMNRTAEEIFDVFSKLATSEPIDVVIHHEQFIAMFRDFVQSDRTSTAFTMECSRAKQPKSFYKVSIVRAMNEFGEEIGFISVFVDMTREHELSRMKTSILHVVSHELKTPLAGIIGFLHLLLKEGKDYLKRDHYDFVITAKNSADNLKQLVNNLLDLSRLDSGHCELNVSSFDLIKVIRDLAAAFRLRADEKGIRIELHLHAAMCMLSTDMQKTTQVLSNIIDNAIKFTEEGSVSIETSGQPSSVSITVTDTGVGIPAESIPHIFDQFRQVDSSLSRSHEGVGLGLSIVKELITLLNGSVTVESIDGKGTKFVVTLPKPIKASEDEPS